MNLFTMNCYRTTEMVTFLFTESFSDWSSVSTSGLKSAQYDHYFCTYNLVVGVTSRQLGHRVVFLLNFNKGSMVSYCSLV